MSCTHFSFFFPIPRLSFSFLVCGGGGEKFHPLFLRETEKREKIEITKRWKRLKMATKKTTKQWENGRPSLCMHLLCFFVRFSRSTRCSTLWSLSAFFQRREKILSSALPFLPAFPSPPSLLDEQVVSFPFQSSPLSLSAHPSVSSLISSSPPFTLSPSPPQQDDPSFSARDRQDTQVCNLTLFRGPGSVREIRKSEKKGALKAHVHQGGQ
mmetsp:Transcript_14597/g.29381  ORF Transcript_14597/g.29381 Transcript_14597/m.29381 type:complete len:211 (+) Transcript_14597:2365-2997(+)